MSRATIKAEIDANIKQNGNQEITGLILNSVLNQINDGHTTKVRVDITGTTGSYQFKIGNQVLNFQDLNNLLQVSPDFLVFVHGKREHRCTFIDLDSNPKQMRFVAPLLNDGTLKTQSFYVTSNDGVAITSIVSSNINCENSSNKRSDLSNPNNTNYPTTKAVSDALTVRDTKLSELQTEVTKLEKEVFNSSKLSITVGDFTKPGLINIEGTFIPNNYYISTELIPCKDIKEITAQVLFADDYAVGIAFYGDGGVTNFLGGIGNLPKPSTDNVFEYTTDEIPEDTKYVAFTSYSSTCIAGYKEPYAKIQIVGESLKDELHKKLSEESERAINEEKTLGLRVDEIFYRTSIEEIKEYDNSIFSISDKLIIASNGQEQAQSGYVCTPFIPIPEGVTKIEAKAIFGDSYEAGIAYYTSDNAESFILSRSNTRPSFVDEYVDENIPANAKFMRLTNYPARGEGYVKIHTNTVNIGGRLIDDEKEIAKNSSASVGMSPIRKTASVFNNNDEIQLCESHAKKNKQMAFFGTLGTLGTLKIYHGETEYDTGWIEIDSTKITIYGHDSSIHKRLEEAHGLTIESYIGVIAACGNEADLSVTIVTRGGSKTVKTAYWWASNGIVRAKSFGCSMTNVSFSYNVDDYKKPIWMFGDSYFDFKDVNRWPTWMRMWGFDNVGAFGFPGADSSEEYPEWKRCLNQGTPKYAIWCLGMNDQENGSMNASWLNHVNKFIADCEEHNIIPILATIPNVPPRNNMYKNNWVKASGYRYIDFAEAVGSYASSNWYNGMLSADNVHPTQFGAVALAIRALSDVPELIQK